MIEEYTIAVPLAFGLFSYSCLVLTWFADHAHAYISYTCSGGESPAGKGGKTALFSSSLRYEVLGNAGVNIQRLVVRLFRFHGASELLRLLENWLIEWLAGQRLERAWLAHIVTFIDLDEDEVCRVVVVSGIQKWNMAGAF